MPDGGRLASLFLLGLADKGQHAPHGRAAYKMHLPGIFTASSVKWGVAKVLTKPMACRVTARSKSPLISGLKTRGILLLISNCDVAVHNHASTLD